MALEAYKQKRSFKKTSEPTGGKSASEKLIFVVQKHHASHLHYDFRLEMKGVLKSWAVPKGPSMVEGEKHLAILVEDHPYDYKDFEGKIPKGNYGAGTVIVWDNGTYEPVEKAKTKKEKEHLLLKGFYSGSLAFKLHGKKLKGVFSLKKDVKQGENGWSLTKEEDSYTLSTDITEKDESVVSGETIEELEGVNKASAIVIPMQSKEARRDVPNFLEQAKEAEAQQEFKSAEKLYKQHLNKHPIDEFAYNRLMIIYRKQKMYKDELAIINRAIKALEDFYAKRAQKRVGKNNKIKTLSNNLIKSLGLADKKGNALYEPEPLPTWKKRKAVALKKLHK